MDWNFKASWDLAELEQPTLPNIGRVNASARYGVTRTEDDFSVDLMLGQVGNSSSGSLQKWKESGVSKTVPLPSRSSKRARALKNATQAVACLVDGCNSELRNCRDYHRRHKVCELHSKTPEVTVGGQKQRFCQQCSRFHLLEEFDEGKRSCRKRLDGHNRRRRKSQPEPITRATTFLSTYQGSYSLRSSTSHVYPSKSLGSSWTGFATCEEDASLQNQHQHLYLVDRQSMFMRSSDTSYRENKQYSFLQEENFSFSKHCGNPTQSTSIRQNIFCNGIACQAHESHRALSLLSSPQKQETTVHGLNPIKVLPEGASLAQLLGLSLHDHNFESVDSSVMVTTGAGGSNLHGTGMYNMGTEESQGNEAPQVFPFTWD